MYLDISEKELQMIYEEIMTMLGAFSIDVDITKEELLIVLRRTLMEFEKETSIWQINNQFGNVYGLPAGMLMSNQIATMNFQICNQITDWFASMARVGGKIPWHKDYITLEAGRQIYDLSKESSKPYIPGSRRIHRVMWLAQPEIVAQTKYTNMNPYGDDILLSTNWQMGTTGLAYGSSQLAFLGYTFDTILMMQHVEMKNKVVFSEFFHNLSGDILEITPMPGKTPGGLQNGMKVFYYYWDESEVVLNAPNPELYKTTIGSTQTPTGLPAGQSNLIANPVDMKIEYVPWSMLSPWAKTWIFDFALARCKYIQGSKWRKIKKTMAGGEMDYEIEFDYQSLLSESENEMSKLKEDLRQDLKDLSIKNIVNDKAEIAASASKVNNKTPRMWFFG